MPEDVSSALQIPDKSVYDDIREGAGEATALLKSHVKGDVRCLPADQESDSKGGGIIEI